ncbi:MAG: ribbon-helix-helix domain-containing protein [Alphaproteobacteria bacterium]
MVVLVNKIICLNARNTCIRLCDKEWEAFDEICLNEKIKRKKLVEKIKAGKSPDMGLTPAIRLFTTLYYRNLCEAFLHNISKLSTDELIEQLL